MRAISLAVVGFVVAAAGTANGAITVSPADMSGVHTLNGGYIPANPFQTRTVPGTNISIYSGVASAAGNLFLIEASPSVRDDVVTLGTTNEQINDYAAGAAAGAQRFVTSSTSVNGLGQDVITLTISARDASGGLADLWPAGFVSGTTALTSGGIGFGFNLGALGNNPMNIAPDNNVISATVSIATAGVFAAPLSLPTATFFAPSPANWNGILGVSFGNGATGADVQSDVQFVITVTPAPGSAALLGLGGLVAFRRRRS